MVLKGKKAITRIRKLNGDTKNPKPGTIRKKFATNVTKNAVHASDSKKSSDREIKIFSKIL